MSLRSKGFWSVVVAFALAAGLAAQIPGEPASPETQAPPNFRVQIDAVTMDVVVKDSSGRFVPDLTREDFEIYEDGVRQDLATLTVSHGGRVTNVLEAPPPVVPEGIILPAKRIVNDTSGRIFLFFVDDLHLQFQSSGRVRDIFKRISRLLVHEGDLFGIVSSGPSSIAIDMTYDRKRLDEAIEKIHGDGLKPSEIIERSNGSGGPTELRHRARVAFTTMLEGLRNLEVVTNRRKALVWVSEGYDFNPYQQARLGLYPPGSPFLQNPTNRMMNELSQSEEGGGQEVDRTGGYQARAETFSDADLAYELGEITRAANRANTTIYTIDPRGLVAGGDVEEQVEPREWARHLSKTQDTMRVLAEETGGLAVVNQNDFDKALKQIDAESSDYYVLGYYSNNPDPTHRRRQIEVRLVGRDGLDVYARKEYVLRAQPQPAPAPAPSNIQ
jgi:VWFA-related protein